MFIVLHLTIKKLYSWDLIPTNFYDGLVRPETVTPSYKKEPLTQDEVQRFLAYFKGHWLEHAMHLLFCTGLRNGELLALKWENIELLDDERGFVHVEGAIGITEVGFGLKDTKTKSSVRTIPFTNKHLVQLLKQARENNKTGWVVENKSKTARMRPDNFRNRYFKKIGIELGFTKTITSHVARHTYISHLVNLGVPLTTIAKWSGHTDIEMIVKVYSHPITDEQTEFALAGKIYQQATPL